MWQKMLQVGSGGGSSKATPSTTLWNVTQSSTTYTLQLDHEPTMVTLIICYQGAYMMTIVWDKTNDIFKQSFYNGSLTWESSTNKTDWLSNYIKINGDTVEYIAPPNSAFYYSTRVVAM